MRGTVTNLPINQGESYGTDISVSLVERICHRRNIRSFFVFRMPITGAMRSIAWFFGHAVTGIADLNPTRSKDVS
jgi:hypothetical protein